MISSSKKKFIKIYLISFIVLVHLALGLALYHGTKSFLYSGSTFANAAISTGYKIQKEYPSIKFFADFLISTGEKFQVKDYFWEDFNISNWPSVGPQDIGHFTNAIPELSIKNIKFVSDNSQLIEAVSNAIPGNIIVVKNGDYQINMKKLAVNKLQADKENPIYLVAENIGEVNITLDATEGLYIDQPYWRVIGFNFQGVCLSQSKCDHAFHIVGNGSNFYAAHNTFADFNAAIKINRLNDVYPDHGNLEYNYFYFTKPRQVKNSVTPINLDHGNQWTVAHNVIRDFSKSRGNKISYGLYFKGGVTGGTISNNLVVCNSQEKPNSSVHVGMSIGGGGMLQHHRRDNAEFEAENIVIKNNIVMHCNDVALYVNKGKDSIIFNNTFYNTSGLDLRFPITSGRIENNILNGSIRHRDNANGEVNNNVIIKQHYWDGSNDMKDIYQSPNIGNFAIKNASIIQSNINYELINTLEDNAKDFCDKPHDTNFVIGATQIKSDCFYKKAFQPNLFESRSLPESQAYVGEFQ